MASAKTQFEVTVGAAVTYHGSVIAAHGDGRIVAVHENGRVDIEVTELVYGLRQQGMQWVEIPSLTVHGVRPQSFKPVVAEVGSEVAL